MMCRSHVDAASKACTGQVEHKLGHCFCCCSQPRDPKKLRAVLGSVMLKHKHTHTTVRRENFAGGDEAHPAEAEMVGGRTAK